MRDFEIDLSGRGDVAEGKAVLEEKNQNRFRGENYHLSDVSLVMRVEGENYEEEREHNIESAQSIGGPHKDYFSISRVVDDDEIDTAHLRDMHPYVQTSKIGEGDAQMGAPILLYADDMETVSNKDEREIYIRSKSSKAGNRPFIDGNLQTDTDLTTYSFGGFVRTNDVEGYTNELMDNLGLPTTQNLREEFS